MKKYLVILIGILLYSCASKKEETRSGEIVITDTPVNNITETTQQVYNPETKLFIWRASPDYTREKNTALGLAGLPVDSLIKGLNEYYSNIYLQKKAVSGDTLYTEIKNSEYLTQRMGTTGAEIYLADVVLNLTSVPGIRYVNIAFEEGDHAGPGVWSAENFKQYKEKNPR